jgi:hypothetical protein
MANDRFFDPWVGTAYGGGIFDKKVLVVGASHYCGDGCSDCGDPDAHPGCRGFTRRVVRDYLDDGYAGDSDWKRTFSAFVDSVFGRETSANERDSFFDSIVFTNYLQRAEGRDADEKYGEWFDDSRHLRAFLSLLDEYRPDVVVVWGSRVWNAIPWNLGDGEADRVTDDIFRFRRSGHEFLLVKLHHPSQGYPFAASHAILQKAGVVPEF